MSTDSSGLEIIDGLDRRHDGEGRDDDDDRDGDDDRRGGGRRVVTYSGVPAYASACSGTARFSSACSCFGITTSTYITTTTVATPVRPLSL